MDTSVSVVLSQLLESFSINCILFFVTLAFALPLGLVISFGSRSRFKLLSVPIQTFVWIIRGTPLMLQIIVIYFGPGLLDLGTPWPSGGVGRITAACVAFVINYACYFSEIYRGGIEGIPVGTVATKDESDDEMSFTLGIRLFTDFGRLNDVYVMALPPREELTELEKDIKY